MYAQGLDNETETLANIVLEVPRLLYARPGGNSISKSRVWRLI